MDKKQAPREEVRLVRPFVTSDNNNLDTSDVMPLAESDGTTRVQLVGWDGAQERVGVETSSELKVSNYGTNGGTATAIKVESTGEQDMVLHGKDSGGTIDPLRTNADQQLQVETIDNEGNVARKVLGQDGDVSTETVLYTVPASTVTVVDKIVAANREAAANTVSIGISVGGGALAAADYIINAFDIPANDSLILDGPFYMAATDELRVVAEDANVTLSAFGREYA